MSQTDRHNDSYSDETVPPSHQQQQSERLCPPSRSYGTIESFCSRQLTISGTETPAAATPQFDDMKGTLSFLQKFGYGLGHVYNDLCAGVWFSYTLLFMQSVLGIAAAEAGALIMLGQVCDAISTPIVGLLADRYGTKRKWHVVGTGLVFFSFPMIFSLCPWCETMPGWWTPVYFSVFIVAFQFAWAVVQITHLAMIPELSKTTKDRADLTATRYSASVCANLVVYVIMWIVLQGRRDMSNKIEPSDAYRFRDISLILTLIGLSMSVIFHFSLAVSDYEHRRFASLSAQQHHNSDDEGISSAGRRRSETDRLLGPDVVSVNPDLENSTSSSPSVARIRYRKFFTSPLLYQNAFLYVFSRLFMTTSLVYMPLWLNERSLTQSLTDSTTSIDHLATVPLVSFLASFVSSVTLKQLNRWLSHRVAYLLGSLISLIGCFWIAYATPATSSTETLFSIAVLVGSGSSVTMISSLCITADMIGKNTKQGGFIYSAVTFADKLITGVVVVIIEAMKCKTRTDCPEYYRNVLAYACGVAAVMGILTLGTLQCSKRRPTAAR